MAELNQHDIITKQVLSQKTYAVDFLKNALPKEITSELDFTKLEIEKGNFIDATDQERFTDILYSVPTKKQLDLEHAESSESKRLGVFCLIEHKSYKEKNIHYTASHVFSWNLQNKQNAGDSFSALSRKKRVGYSYALQ